ncbi:hypothetical protein ACFWHR_01805 [Leucobacter sp. NPDC058333]|uniref:hypothetical protein n=1 Tax=Leucobacter sp. NPDC058333 TaxID=3346450 RepID=UPI0036594451
MFLIAVLLAAIGAVGLAVGTHLQHRAVGAVGAVGAADAADAADAASHRSRRLPAYLTHPLWLVGGGIIVVQTAINVVALGLAPVAVVQPVGALALVVAVTISSRALGVQVTRGLVIGIALAVASVAAFVAISAGFAQDQRADQSTISLLIAVLVVLIPAGWGVARRSTGHFARVLCAGTVFGAVASSMHVVAVEAVAALNGDALAPRVWVLLALLLIATAVGVWLVQTAYASGPPETVLAGLTVLDPLVAVLIGAVLLGEYPEMSLLGGIGLALSGLSAAAAIIMIARSHPAFAGAGAAATAPAALANLVEPEDPKHPKDPEETEVAVIETAAPRAALMNGTR